MPLRNHGLMLAAITALAALPALAQPPKDDVRPNRWGYQYPRSYDAEIAAPDVHRVHYQDDHIMLMEVSNPPGYAMQMHGHPYPSVFAFDSDGPPAGGNLSGTSRYLEPSSPKNGQGWRTAPAPKAMTVPHCTAADPQAPHNPVNQGDWPLHFFRIEFLRVDQDDTNAARKLYGAKPRQKLLFQTDAMRLVEVTAPPGATIPAHVEKYPAVMAFDSVAAFEAVSKVAGADAGRSPPPLGYLAPRCITEAPGPVPALVNRSDAPIHYYRIEYKRVDGDGLKTHWREWYPRMVQMQNQKP